MNAVERPQNRLEAAAVRGAVGTEGAREATPIEARPAEREVRISDEARTELAERERHAEQRASVERDVESDVRSGAANAARAERRRESVAEVAVRAEPQPILAARTGRAPLPELSTSSADTTVREALDQRARLPGISDLLRHAAAGGGAVEVADTRAEARPAASESAETRASADVAPESDTFFAAPTGPPTDTATEELVAGSGAAAILADLRSEGESRSERTREIRSEISGQRDSPQLHEAATALAPAVGGVRDGEAETRNSGPSGSVSDDVRLLGDAAARETFSHSSGVEAETRQDLTSEFVDALDTRRLPEPDARAAGQRPTL